ncbi:HD domain-containing phosphohydrolase [Aestuariivirga sp.]|uniref:HD domain-containing phosphohydrolase n=1 Tax=Aestuariivirga sp. TaxID=2650926 RepID=UPI003BAD9F07
MQDKISVLIVDHNRTNLALMDMLLRKVPNCCTQLQTDPAAVIAGLGDLSFDIAIFAGHMPRLSGFELARQVKAEAQFKSKHILLTVDDPGDATRAAALEAGASDVILRPLDPVDFRSRIKTLGRMGDLPPHHAQGHEEAATASPESSPREEEFLTVLVHVAGLKDRETPLHNARVARYCTILANHLGMPESFCRDIRLAAPLHDVGKAGLNDELLHKRGFLTPEERKEMERHTKLGHAMLSLGKSPMFRMAAEIALSHHERWDGGGYPDGLKGDQIPLAARIAAVADVFDALTSFRPYKASWTKTNAFNYLRDNAGEQFDPSCVAAFTSGQDEVEAVLMSMLDFDEQDSADAA